MRRTPRPRPARLRLALLLAVAVGALLPVGARAATQDVPYLGAPPSRDQITTTRLGYATLGQHLLHLGDKVEVVPTFLSDDDAAYAFEVPQDFTIVKGCQGGNLKLGTGSTECQVKAAVPSLSDNETTDCGTYQAFGGGCFHNWTVETTIAINNSQGTGYSNDYFAILPNDRFLVAGHIVDETGHPVTGAPPVALTMTSSGGSVATAVTDASAGYGAVLHQDPAVRVTPPDGYSTYHCPGAPGADGSCTIDLSHDYTDVDFVAKGFEIDGSVLDATGKGVAGSTVTITGPRSTTATTDAGGHFSATELPRGTYSVTAGPKGTEFPVPSTDCKADNLSCTVMLNQTRTVKFTSCVQPDPSGAPLPADTPDPIPGAISTGTLEAVGCFTPPPANSTTATTTRPVRLDGVDVSPAAGTTISVDQSASTVTSDGPATLSIAGHAIATPDRLDLGYVGADPSTGALNGTTGTTAFPNLFGLPLTFNVNGPTALPWATSRGSTSMQLGVGVPFGLIGTWSAAAGKFLPTVAAGAAGLAGAASKLPASVQSLQAGPKAAVGLSGTLTVTNRDGLKSPKVCGSVGNLSPWGTEGTGIEQLELCYDAGVGSGGVGSGQWTGTGAVTLPNEPGEPPARVKVTLGLLDYQLNQGSITASTLNLPLADGVFLQSIGAGFSRDLTRGVASSLTGTGQLSFGPGVGESGAELLALDGALTVQPWSVPAFYKATGSMTLAQNTPLASTISNAFIAFTPGNGILNSKLDFGGNLQLSLPSLLTRFLGRTDLLVGVSGFYDDRKAAVQFSGSTTLNLPKLGHTVVSVLSNNNVLGLCDEHDGYSVGFTVPYANPSKPSFYGGNCDLSKFSLTQSPTTFKPAPRAAGAGHALSLPSGLAGVTLAVRGTTAPPQVKLSGPSLSLTAGGAGALTTKDALVYRDPSTRTTFVALFKPAGGAYRVTALKGSSPIASVMQSLPAPQPKLAATVAGPPCRPSLRYALAPATGRTVALYEVDALQRRSLGDAKAPAGTLALAAAAPNIGDAHVEADTLADGLVQSTQVLGSFPTAATTAATAPQDLAVKGRRLSWTAGCDVARSVVTAVAGKRHVTLTTTGTSVTLPMALHGRVELTVTSVDATGRAGGAATKTVRR